MKCIYCDPTLQGKGKFVRIAHKRCSTKIIPDNVIKEYTIKGEEEG